MALNTPFGEESFLRPLRSSALLGWLSHINFDIACLLYGRDADWLNDVATQVLLVLAPESERGANWAERLLQSSPSNAKDAPWGPGIRSNVALFAHRGSTFAWNAQTTKTHPWERYAVYAALYAREALDRLEGASFLAVDALNEAGGYAIEAMYALQTAQSLRSESNTKTLRARMAANARHIVFQRLPEVAVAMAKSRPFRTKEEALDYITSNLLIDPTKNKFCSRSAASKWLREAGWQADAGRKKA
jgi:hypothetical protein